MQGLKPALISMETVHPHNAVVVAPTLYVYFCWGSDAFVQS